MPSLLVVVEAIAPTETREHRPVEIPAPSTLDVRPGHGGKCGHAKLRHRRHRAYRPAPRRQASRTRRARHRPDSTGEPDTSRVRPPPLGGHGSRRADTGGGRPHRGGPAAARGPGPRLSPGRALRPRRGGGTPRAGQRRGHPTSARRAGGRWLFWRAPPRQLGEVRRNTGDDTGGRSRLDHRRGDPPRASTHDRRDRPAVGSERTRPQGDHPDPESRLPPLRR